MLAPSDSISQSGKESNSSSESEPEPEDPFIDFPKLNGFQLSGVRVALTKARQQIPALPLEEDLWRSCRGTEDSTQIKVQRVSDQIARLEPLEAFSPAPFPINLEVPDYVRKQDDSWKQRQKELAQVARPLVRGIILLEQAVKKLGEGEDIQENLNTIREGVAVPLSHSMRLLASQFNDLAARRKSAAVQAIRDDTLKEELRRMKVGMTSLFKEDITPLVQASEARQHKKEVRVALASKRGDSRHHHHRHRGQHSVRRDEKRESFKKREYPKKGSNNSSFRENKKQHFKKAHNKERQAFQQEEQKAMKVWEVVWHSI